MLGASTARRATPSWPLMRRLLSRSAVTRGRTVSEARNSLSTMRRTASSACVDRRLMLLGVGTVSLPISTSASSESLVRSDSSISHTVSALRSKVQPDAASALISSIAACFRVAPVDVVVTVVVTELFRNPWVGSDQLDHIQ